MKSTKHLLFFISLSILFNLSCASLQDFIKKRPTAKIETVSIHGLSFDKIDLKTRISIENPYPVDISVLGIKLKALIENSQLFSTNSTKKIKISGNKKSFNDFIISLKFKDLQRAARDYLKKDYLNLTLDSKIKVSLPSIPGLPSTAEIPVKIKKQIPAVKISINMKKFKINFPSKKDIIKAAKKSKINILELPALLSFINGKNSSKGQALIKKLNLTIPVDVTFEIKNQAKSSININNFNYDLKINNKQFINGLTNNIKNIGQISEITLRNNLSLNSLSASTLKVLKKRKFNYSLSAKSKFKIISNLMRDPVDINFTKTGSFK